jgi:hypothetical protein
VEKIRPRYTCHRRTDLLSGVDYVDSESIDYLPVDIVAVCSGDQDFALVVVYEDSAYHSGTLDGFTTDE